jgi:diacylglycerol kinase family enzyme
MVVILNGGARRLSGRGEEMRGKIAELFSANGLRPAILAPSGKDLNATVRDVATGHAQTIVAGGGDGTVSTVAAEVFRSGKTLGVLPLGTLNHFAKDLRIPLDLEGAVRTIGARHVGAIDIAEVNERAFINNSSLGIYPHIVVRREVEQYRLKRGKWTAFVWATLHAFRRFPFLDLRIEIEGETVTRQTPFVFVGNNEYEMTGFRIGARRRLDTGKLGLYLTHRIGRWGLIRLALNALFGRLNQAKDFEVHLVEEARIDSGRRALLVATDGEVRWMDPPLHFRIRPRGLRVIVPREASE